MLLSASAMLVGETGIADCSFPVDEIRFDDFEFTDEDFEVQDFFSEEISPFEGWDLSWAYQFFVTLDGVMMDGETTYDVEAGFDDTEVVDEGSCVKVNIFHSLSPEANEEGLIVDDMVAWEDMPPDEDWDPSWLYRLLTSVSDVGNEGFILDLATGWEEGLGCGVAPEGFESGEVTFNEFEGNGDQPQDDFVLHLSDPLPIDDTPGEPEDVVDDGELVPIRTLDSNDFDLNLFAYSMAPDGIELQRSNDYGDVQEESAFPLSLGYPVTSSRSNSVFSANTSPSTNVGPIGSQSNLAVAGNPNPAKRNATVKRSSTLVRTSSPSAAVSEGLNSLTPLLGGDTTPNENDGLENTVNPEAAESRPIDETVSHNGNASPVVSGYARQRVPARNARVAMIEQVMAEYAENSFDS